MRVPRVLAAAVALACVGRFAAAANEPPRPQEQPNVTEGKSRFEAGRAFYEKKEYARALIEFQAGFASTNNPAFLVNTGLCLRRLDRREEAIADFRSFLEMDPKSALRPQVEGYLAELGVTDVAAEPAPPEAAKPSRTRTGARTPAGEDEGPLATARALFDKKDYERALLEFQRAYATTNDPAILLHTGLCMKALGRRDEAVEELRTLLKLDPKTPVRSDVEKHLVELGALDPAAVTAAAEPRDPRKRRRRK